MAIERSRQRNLGHLEAGRLELRQAAPGELDVRAGSIDLAFSLNVNLFWTGR